MLGQHLKLGGSRLTLDVSALEQEGVFSVAGTFLICIDDVGIYWIP
jgi:hypothetical protein